MTARMTWTCAVLMVAVAGTAAGQTADDARGSDTQLGASFVGSTGNARATTMGADFSMNYRRSPWTFETAFNAVRIAGRDAPGIERYLESARIRRKLTSRVGVTGGERLEHDPLAGMDFRSIVDGGLEWKFVQKPEWLLDGITALAWNHERPAPLLDAKLPVNDADAPIAFLQLRSRIPLGKGGETKQRVTAYPNLRETALARYEAEVTVQASMSDRLALTLGYLVRYTHRPVARFGTTDGTVTASVVVKWKTTEAAKAP